MKKILIILSIVLASCGGGPSEPPFYYNENSRIIVEGVVQDENGAILVGQKVEVNSRSSGSNIIVKTIYSDSSGKIFLSIPTGNYKYYINFLNKRIVFMQRNQELILFDGSTNQNTGILGNFQRNYYDLEIIKLKNI